MKNRLPGVLCRACGKPLVGRLRGRIYCSDVCRKIGRSIEAATRYKETRDVLEANRVVEIAEEQRMREEELDERERLLEAREAEVAEKEKRCLLAESRALALEEDIASARKIDTKALARKREKEAREKELTKKMVKTPAEKQREEHVRRTEERVKDIKLHISPRKAGAGESLRKCHTCGALTTQYWCAKCRAVRKAKYGIPDNAEEMW